MRDVAIIEAMQRSSRTGRWVTLKPLARKARPNARQDIRRPAVPREPALVAVRAASR